VNGDLLRAIETEALRVLQENALFAPGGLGERWLCLRSLEDRPGKTLEIPLYDTPSGWPPGELVPPIGVASLTATEKQVVVVEASNDALETTPHSLLIAEIGRRLGVDAAAKIDAEVMALFSGFSQRTGVSETNCSYGDVQDAVDLLALRNAPHEYLCVLHPQQWYDLLTEPVSPITAVPGVRECADIAALGFASLNYFTATLFGHLTAVVPGVPLVNDGQDRMGAVLAKGALARLWKWRPRVTQHVGEKRTLFTLSACYDVALLDETLGVPVVTDA